MVIPLVLVVGGILALIAWGIVARVTGWQRKQEERLARQLAEVRGAPAAFWRRLVAPETPAAPVAAYKAR